MKRDLRFETVYPQSPERVWRALTDPTEMAQWLMTNNFEARLGHKFQFTTKPAPGFDGIVNCEVIELDSPRRLAYRWKGGTLDSVVSFTLQPVSEGTRLVLEHKGFSGSGEFMLSALLEKGWHRMLEQRLPAFLQGSEAPSTDRATNPVDALINRYTNGVTTFTNLLHSVPASELDRTPAPDRWNIRQTAMHIIDAELMSAGRMRMLAAEPGSVLTGYHGDTWARELHYATLPLEPAVDLFVQLRKTTATVLRGLSPDAWTRGGTHTETGGVTLEHYLLSHCEHTEAHMDEIRQMMEHKLASA